MRMSGLLRSTLRRYPAFTAPLLAGTIVVSGCGTNQAALPADSPIGIQSTQLAVTVENKSGMPLVGVSVVVETPGLDYTKTLARLENAERHDIRLDEFTSKDGTRLNLRAVQPRAVRVTATDLTNKGYDIATSWR
jgi:hypothetical protein